MQITAALEKRLVYDGNTCIQTSWNVFLGKSRLEVPDVAGRSALTWLTKSGCEDGGGWNCLRIVFNHQRCLTFGFSFQFVQHASNRLYYSLLSIFNHLNSLILNYGGWSCINVVLTAVLGYNLPHKQRKNTAEYDSVNETSPTAKTGKTMQRVWEQSAWSASRSQNEGHKAAGARQHRWRENQRVDGEKKLGGKEFLGHRRRSRNTRWFWNLNTLQANSDQVRNYKIITNEQKLRQCTHLL